METGSSTTMTALTEPTAEMDEVSGYRSLSGLALAGLALGVVAPLCLAAPLLMAIPLAGIVVAALALRQISQSEGAMIGRTAALVGLALCVGSIATAMTRSAVKDWLLSSQARAVAEQWIALVQSGDSGAAFKLTTESMRPVEPPSPASPAAAEPAPDPLTRFRENPVVAYLLSHGDHIQVRYNGEAEPGEGPLSRFRIDQLFVVEDAAHEAESPMTLQLSLQRSRVGEELRWLVADYLSDALLPEAHDHDHDHAHHHH